MFLNICERFPYPYEYVYFSCSHLARIFLDVNMLHNEVPYLMAYETNVGIISTLILAEQIKKKSVLSKTGGIIRL